MEAGTGILMGVTITKATASEANAVIDLVMVTEDSGSIITGLTINPIEIITKNPIAAITPTVVVGIQDTTIGAMIAGVTIAITGDTVMEDIHLITIGTEMRGFFHLQKCSCQGQKPRGAFFRQSFL